MKALEMMKRFGLEGLENRKVTEVSGGQLQRVCIIRSMIMEPALIFADEPTGALNQSAAAEVMESFLEINRSGTAILMVTHDMKVAMKCDRIIYLVDGKVRGELALGKFIESNIETREKKASEWLSSLGW